MDSNKGPPEIIKIGIYRCLFVCLLFIRGAWCPIEHLKRPLQHTTSKRLILNRNWLNRGVGRLEGRRRRRYRSKALQWSLRWSLCQFWKRTTKLWDSVDTRSIEGNVDWMLLGGKNSLKSRKSTSRNQWFMLKFRNFANWIHFLLVKQFTTWMLIILITHGTSEDTIRATRFNWLPRIGRNFYVTSGD